MERKAEETGKLIENSTMVSTFRKDENDLMWTSSPLCLLFDFYGLGRRYTARHSTHVALLL